MPSTIIESSSVRRIRSKLGLTQEQLATAMDVSTVTIRSWESGERVCGGPAARLLLLMRKDPRLVAKSAITR